VDKIKEFVKNLSIVILALYFYFAILFILGFIITWTALRISTSVFELPLTDLLMYVSAGIIFISLASVDLYLVSQEKWSPVTIILLIPFVIYEFIKAVVKKTVFTFDTRQTPRKYKELDDSFKYVLKPIQKHFN